MIKINNLTKTFDKKMSLNNIDLKINKGSIVGLIGANGAGKSTLLRTIMGIYDADKGEVLIDNENIHLNPLIKEKIGYVADKNDYFNKFKVNHILKHYELTYKNFSYDKFNKLNEIFDVPLYSMLSKLSKGTITKVFFMLALSINPEILILDEPTSGLDPMAKRKFLKLLLSEVYEKNITVIISSHNLNDLEAICDHIAFIEKGEIVENNSLENLKHSMKKLQVIFKNQAPENFEKWDEFISVEKIGKSYNVVTSNYNENLTKKLKENDALFIEELDLSLEDMLIYRMEHIS